jgi:hypothetical protein
MFLQLGTLHGSLDQSSPQLLRTVERHLQIAAHGRAFLGGAG